ncbi:helix-turn-helix domain-containing protein [Chelatococcus sp. GCM10030263]|uniref:helix-turn-helix domain-containing protein n=1 Tax=Chelatococcus sp. GCM10030263 TaxID=3273387 RepID=UPI00360DD153
MALASVAFSSARSNNKVRSRDIARGKPDGAARPCDDRTRAQAFVGATVAEMERALILSTLDHCDGNRTSAAKILGISLRSLRNKLTSYSAAGVTVPAPQVSRQERAST